MFQAGDLLAPQLLSEYIRVAYALTIGCCNCYSSKEVGFANSPQPEQEGKGRISSTLCYHILDSVNWIQSEPTEVYFKSLI